MLHVIENCSVNTSEEVVSRLRRGRFARLSIPAVLVGVAVIMSACADPEASYVGTQAMDTSQQSGLGNPQRDRPIVIEPAPPEASVGGTQRYQWNGNPVRRTEGKAAPAGQAAKQPNLKPQPAAEAPAETPGDAQVVEVQPGDTLYGIAERHGVTVASLTQANALSGAPLKVGQKLVLPPAAR